MPKNILFVTLEAQMFREALLNKETEAKLMEKGSCRGSNLEFA